MPLSPPGVGSALTFPQGGLLFQSKSNQFQLTWPTGEQGELSGSSFKLRLPSARQQVEGLLGSAPNGDRSDDLHLSTGEILPHQLSVEQLYQDYGHSWRISQAESLFDYAPGQSTDTFTDLGFPYAPAVISSSERQTAESICQGAGINDPNLLESCIFDVAITGDQHFATEAAEVQQNLSKPTESVTLYKEVFPNHTGSYTFGKSASVDGDRILISEPYSQSAIEDAKVYLYDAKTGSLQHTFTKTPDQNVNFGGSVSISGDRILIGDDHVYTNAESGVVYLYDANSGSLLRTFDSPAITKKGRFGISVSIFGDKALIGEPTDSSINGRAYLYDINTGALLHSFSNLGAFGYFGGGSVSLSEDRVVIGVSGYVYVYDANNGTLLQTITAPTRYKASFGVSAVSGHHVLVGDPYYESAYLYDTESGAMLQQYRISSASHFGSKVSISGDRLLIGSGETSYLYDVNGNQLQVFPNSGQNYSEVSISQDRALYGSVGGSEFRQYLLQP